MASASEVSENTMHPARKDGSFIWKVLHSGAKGGTRTPSPRSPLRLRWIRTSLLPGWAGVLPWANWGGTRKKSNAVTRLSELDPYCVDAWNNKAFAFGMLDRFEDKVEVLRTGTGDRSGECHGLEQQGCCPRHARQVRSRDPLL